MTNALTDTVARAMLASAEDHGSLEDFIEKLLDYPEQYLSELADAAIVAVLEGIRELSDQMIVVWLNALLREQEKTRLGVPHDDEHRAAHRAMIDALIAEQRSTDG